MSPDTIETWIERQLQEKLPGAESLGHEARAGGFYFWIRSDLGNLWLIVERRVCRALSIEELTQFLDEEGWLDQLREARCIRVQMPGICPALVRPSGLLV